MAGQLDRLMVSTTTRRSLSRRAGRRALAFHADNGFWLYDADAVIIETSPRNGRLTTRRSAVYTRVHAALAETGRLRDGRSCPDHSAIAAL